MSYVGSMNNASIGKQVYHFALFSHSSEQYFVSGLEMSLPHWEHVEYNNINTRQSLKNLIHFFKFNYDRIYDYYFIFYS